MYLCLFRVKSMVPFTPCTWVCLGSIHWSHLHPVLESVVGSIHLRPVLLSVIGLNPRSDLHPVLVIKSTVRFTPCTCDQYHGPIYTLYLWSIPWSHLHVSVVGLNSWSFFLCLLWGQNHGSIYMFVVGSNPWTHLHPVLCLFRVKSKVPFTPCTFVCCGVKSMVRFTPCTGDQIHGPIYTLYLWSNPWSHWHPVYVIKFLVPFTHCSCVCCGVKSMDPFTPCLVSV